jgi:hypothetical protein
MTLAPSGHAYPINLEAQLRWHAAQYQAPAPHPAPLVPARGAMPHEITRAPRTVAAMRSLGWKCGWRANVTYAHGTSITAMGKPGRLLESLALRMRYPAERYYLGAVAVWETNTKGGWTLDGSWFWPTTGQAFSQRLGADELKHLITEASVIASKPAAWRWLTAIDIVECFRSIKAEAKATRAAGRGQAATYSIIDELAGQAALPLAA